MTLQSMWFHAAKWEGGSTEKVRSSNACPLRSVKACGSMKGTYFFLRTRVARGE